MGYSSFDQLGSDYQKAGAMIIRPISKTTGTQVAAVGYTWWQRPGTGGTGAVPTGNLTSAIKLSGSVAGGQYGISNCPAGSSYYLAKFGIGRNNSAVTIPGTYLLADRLAHFNVPANQATGSLSPALVASDRLAAGEGGQIMCEVTTAFAPAGSTMAFVLQYTNEAGTANRLTPAATVVAASVIERTPFASYFFLPLQTGDKGVRSIEGYQASTPGLFSGGSFTIAVIKPLCWIGGDTFCIYNERENAVGNQAFAQVHQDACLTIYGNMQTIGTQELMGEIVLGCK